ncbi:chaplin [Streptomyces sp. NPDC060194]|uniref:chaplin n=1 Tax=Streptomyces sp. NPDC060194 TaxID=3347069 RepID=UPI00364BE16C
MRQVAKKGVLTVAAAGGMLAAFGGQAHADSGATGDTAQSPGVLSGNNVQVPVHVPVNLCGNTVNVVGLLNPAAGNSCANASAPKEEGYGGGSGTGATAEGSSTNSPGVGSGNQVQVPVDIPVNVCGNSVDVVGLLNPATGNDCGNRAVEAPPGEPGEPVVPETPEEPTTPGTPGTPATPETPGTPAEPAAPGPRTQSVTPPTEVELAATGAETPLGIVLPASAGLLVAGGILYRRARAKA